MVDTLKSLAFYVLANKTKLKVLSVIPTHKDVDCCPFFNAQYNIQLSNGAYLYKLSFAVKGTSSSLGPPYLCFICHQLIPYDIRRWNKHKCSRFKNIYDLQRLGEPILSSNTASLWYTSLESIVLYFQSLGKNISVTEIRFSLKSSREVKLDICLPNNFIIKNISIVSTNLCFCRSCVSLYIPMTWSYDHNRLSIEEDYDSDRQVYHDLECPICQTFYEDQCYCEMKW